jgi:hypothetical protein
MLRVIHAYDIKPGIEERSFVEWLDSQLDQTTKKFGCIGRKTWIFLDGFEGTYENQRPAKRPRYLNEAFWVSEEAANNFRKWLLSEDGRVLRTRWFTSIINHTVLRYVDYEMSPIVGDD